MENTLLNLVPASYLPEVHLSQYDIGRTITFTLKDGASDYSVPSGASVTVKATKPSGLGFEVACTFNGGVVTLVTTETMTPENGRFPAELSIVSGNTVIGTSNFIFNIERSPHPEGTIDGDAESLLPELTLLVERIEDSNARIESMTATATTLATGEDATAEYDSVNNQLVLGLPRGEKGEQGEGVASLEPRVSANQNAINVLSARMDAFASLPEGSTSGNAELLDIRVGASGQDFTTAGNAVRGQTNALANNINGIKGDLFRENAFDGFYKSGFYGTADGSYNPSRTDYICTVNPILCEGITPVLLASAPYRLCYVMYYDANDSYISYQAIITQYTPYWLTIPENAKYFHISITNNGETLNPITAEPFVLYLGHVGLSGIDTVISSFNNNNDYFLNWQNFIYFFGDPEHKFKVENYRIGIAEPLVAKDDLLIEVNSGYKFAANYFSSTTIEAASEIKISGWRTDPLVIKKGEIVLINIAHSDDSAISPSEGINLSIRNYASTLTQWDDFESYVKSKFITHMTHNGLGSYGPMGTRNAIIQPLKFDFDITVSVASGYKYAIQYYDGYATGQDHLVNASPWYTTQIITIPANSYFCMIVADTNDQETDDTTQDNLIIKGYSNANDIYSKLMPLVEESTVSKSSINYVVGADLMKRPVKTELLGALTDVQSFCKYNGKYYSIDGSNIAEQDSSFTELRSAELYTGHGNSLQLGNNGMAYASGWNDQKIYKVDLTNFTIDETITLPTTGYTTYAVDELRGLIYIFQRDSYPDTEANYNFIVYDYVNEEIKSTKEILAFSAMQSVDLFDDKLFVLNGLGGSTTPNGYRVFDLNGNILAEYFFGDFSIIEPEGVCIDRDTHDLYISYVNRNVYKVSA